MHDFVFGILPYIALTVMVISSIDRYERDPFTWKSKSSQILRKRRFLLGSVLFHVGVLVIFFGHLVGLLTPIAVFDAIGISHGAKQLKAVSVGGVAGVMALVGGMILLHGRMTDPRIRAHSTLADTGILWLLMAPLVLGFGSIFISLGHLDGHAMVDLMAWAQGIAYFQAGAAGHLAQTHWIFKLHIALGLVIFALFPFTRLVHIVSAPVRYLWRPGCHSRRGTKPVRTGLKPFAAPAETQTPARPVPMPSGSPQPAE